jgi:murein DD-endopeptidase MepM/ murein hydrolase activator NlpD
MRKEKPTNSKVRGIKFKITSSNSVKTQSLVLPYWVFALLLIPVVLIFGALYHNMNRILQLETTVLNTNVDLGQINELSAILTEQKVNWEDEKFELLISFAEERGGLRQETLTLQSNLENLETQISEIQAQSDSILAMRDEIALVFSRISDSTLPIVFDEPEPEPLVIETDIEVYEGGVTEFETPVSLEFLDLTSVIRDFEFFLEQAEEMDAFLDVIPRGWPVESQIYGAGFGWRLDPFTRDTWEFHNGIDLRAEEGTPVHVTADGVVIVARLSDTGYGNLVVVQHAFGYTTYYSHLLEIHVAEGREVFRGQIIGLSGNTGRSTGPHLHYEIRLNDESKDPLPYLFYD